MSNKPHLRPHQKTQQARPIIKLLVAILVILTIFAFGIALAASGRVAPHGRFIPLRGGRWLHELSNVDLLTSGPSD